MEKLTKALKEIHENYDAVYIENKYNGAVTHKAEFDLLKEHFKDDNRVISALSWLEVVYDCYYKSEYTNLNKDGSPYHKDNRYKKDTAFFFVQLRINEIKGSES